MFARIFETPHGWMAVASAGQGISHIILPNPKKEKIEKQLKEITGGKYENSRLLLGLESDMIRYLNGRFIDFTKYPLDFTYSTGFQKSVWFAVKDIPFGKTLTYKQVAEKMGNPRLSRAVGNALNKNPIPILIPCHRVLSEDGIGGFSAGKKLKKTLLTLEGVKTR